MQPYRLRRLIAVLVVLLATGFGLQTADLELLSLAPLNSTSTSDATISKLSVKGRAPKTGYSRNQFGDGWQTVDGCDTRNQILARDLKNVVINPTDGCKVLSGELSDPYTAMNIRFVRGAQSSDDVQIDHVVALSNAWQTGAQYLTYQRRVELANDPLNLLAVDGPTNEKKSDGDAATWVPPNKSFRCQYVKRQATVKKKYALWVTEAEKTAMMRYANDC